MLWHTRGIRGCSGIAVIGRVYAKYVMIEKPQHEMEGLAHNKHNIRYTHLKYHSHQVDPHDNNPTQKYLEVEINIFLTCLLFSEQRVNNITFYGILKVIFFLYHMGIYTFRIL